MWFSFAFLAVSYTACWSISTAVMCAVGMCLAMATPTHPVPQHISSTRIMFAPSLLTVDGDKADADSDLQLYYLSALLCWSFSSSWVFLCFSVHLESRKREGHRCRPDYFFACHITFCVCCSFHDLSTGLRCCCTYQWTHISVYGRGQSSGALQQMSQS